jgi:3-oxoacyl-[acyl-carrier protein] reductase/7-alpha-hydroxysteroid dehydrogenase
MQLQGKTAFITGGSRGIGLGIARAYAEQGATVVMAARDVQVGRVAEEEINRDFPQGRAVFLGTDITDKNCLEEPLDEVVSDIGDINILVNNATPSGGEPTRLEYTDTRSIRNLTEVN